MKRSVTAHLLLLALLAAPACAGDDSLAPPLDPVGSYSATAFFTTSNGVTVDRLAEGVTLDLALAADGTTSGSLVVPLAGGEPVDLTGTWTRQGDVITFDHITDTFIDVLPFELGPGQLRAEGTVGPNLIQVTLSR